MPARGTATTITNGRRICAGGPTGSCRASARCDRPTTARRGKTSASSSTRRRDREACDSANRFVLGGVGDVTAALDADGKDLYLYFSQYVRDGRSQGVAVARLAWADRDAPVGKAAIWNDGAWLPASENASIDGGWEYPLGHATGQQRAAVSRSLGHERRVLGPVDSLEHVSRAVRDAAQSRQGRSVRAGRHLRLVLADAAEPQRLERSRRRS